MPGDDARPEDDANEPPGDEPDLAKSSSGTRDADEQSAVDVGADGAVDAEPEGDAGGFDLSRRKAVVGGVGVLVGAVAGAGATFVQNGARQIPKEEPNSDGKGTLGELRWILEEQHQLAVTSMVEAGDTVELTYETRATERAESRQEIGGVISAYGLIVANDGPSEKLSAEIQGRFEGQATSYHVQAEWVKQWRSGDISDAGVAQRVFNTRQFPEGSEPE